MRSNNMAEISFVIASDENFADWIPISIEQIRKFYPKAIVWLIDLESHGCEKIKAISKASGLRYVFWDINSKKNWPQIVEHQTIKTIPQKAYGIGVPWKTKLINKYILGNPKYHLNDLEKINDYQKLLKIYCQKPFFIQHVRERQKGKIVFLDADAFLINSISYVFDNEFDIGVTIRRKDELDFSIENCQILNSGVIFLGENEFKTMRFLKDWAENVKISKEVYCIEQTVLSRMLYRSIDEAYIDNGFERLIQLSDSSEAKVRSFPCEELNFNWLIEDIDNEKVRVLHFKGGRHQGVRALKNAKKIVYELSK